MLYKIDKKGFVVNEARRGKVQPYYDEVLKEIDKLYSEKLGDNLLSIYIRGSVSVGKAKPGLSDIDCIAVINKDLPEKDLLWVVKYSSELEKKYPQAGFFDLTIVSLAKLKNSKDYKNLRVYLKTQSFLLRGKDILSQLPNIAPGKELARQLYGDLSKELDILRGIFKGEIKDREYLFQVKPLKFWCIWMSRVLLRAGLGIVMTDKPVYSQDLKACYTVFTKDYPQYRREMKQLLKWSIDPISDRKEISLFLDDFSPKFLRLLQQKVLNN